MTEHRTGTREEWLVARLELLKAEKALTRRSDEVARSGSSCPGSASTRSTGSRQSAAQHLWSTCSTAARSC